MKTKSIIATVLLTSFCLSLIAQSFKWANKMGGTKDEHGNSIVIDSYENVYTTGRFYGTVDFDPGPGIANFTSYDLYDIYVQKLDALGNYIWTKQIGGSGNQFGFSITLDSIGNIYVTCKFNGSMDVDPGPGTFTLSSGGTWDVCIIKLNKTGNFVWAKQIEGSGINEECNSFSTTLDDSGNVYTTGYFFGTYDFDPGSGMHYLTSTQGSDIFIQKLDASGNFVYARQIAGGLWDESYSIDVDASHTVFITGMFDKTVDFDPGQGVFNLTAVGTNDMFILKLNSIGNFAWVKQISGTSNEGGQSITVSASGNIYTTGFFSGTVDFDPGPGVLNQIASGVWSIFIQKLDASGNFIWVKSMGGSWVDKGNYIKLDDYENVYTTGVFCHTVDFDPGPGKFNLTSVGNDDAFIQKLDSSGNFLWAINIGGTSDDNGSSVAISSYGNIYITGYFMDTVDFNPDSGVYNLISYGGTDIFIQKLSQCIKTSSIINEIACDNYISPSKKYIWNTTGTYYDTIQNSTDCDSIITINLTINKVDVSVTNNAPTLIANTTGGTYQWLDCDNEYSIISGETNKAFQPTQTGNYAVEVSQNGCTDTSACYNIIITDIFTQNFYDEIYIYPNPTIKNYTIDLGKKYNDIEVFVSDLNGKLTYKKQFQQRQILELSIDKPKGMYFVKINSDDKQAIIKLIKE